MSLMPHPGLPASLFSQKPLLEAECGYRRSEPHKGVFNAARLPRVVVRTGFEL
jgi:hypothetical protein